MEQFLNHHAIRPTAMRLLVAKVLSEATRPLSVQEMETILDTADRTTISRTLQLFQEHGAVHVIDDGSGSVRYEICRHDDSHERHDDEHLHFHCRVCGRTLCLDLPLPEFDMPEGFVGERTNCVVTGVCRDCSGKRRPDR